jgi:hypothetical protein
LSGVFVYSILVATHFIPFGRYTMRCYRVRASISAVKELYNPYWITVTSVAYISLKVKHKEKARILRLFLGFCIGLKNFLFHECKTANSFLSPKCNMF